MATLDGLRAIVGRDAGGDAVLGIDRFGKRGAEVGSVLGRHLAQTQIVQTLLGHGQADQPAPVLGHEVDGLRRDLFGGHSEVAFVFAVLVVDDHDHAAGADFLQRGLNIAEGRLSGHIDPDQNFNREGEVRCSLFAVSHSLLTFTLRFLMCHPDRRLQPERGPVVRPHWHALAN